MLNGFRHLRPPGNGRGRRVSFASVTVYVEDEQQYVRQHTQNPFAADLASSLKQNAEEEVELNEFHHGFQALNGN